MKLEVGTVCSPLDGQLVNGDGVAVRRFGSVYVLAVVDGLGHGPAAHEASTAALAVVAGLAQPISPVSLVEAMHHVMRATRGAAALVIEVAASGTVRGVKVGNVELRLRGGSVPAVVSPGILGRSVQNLHAFEGRLDAGGRLFAFTDGISGRFEASDFTFLNAQDASEAIFDRYRTGHDDATVLVADLKGEGGR